MALPVAVTLPPALALVLGEAPADAVDAALDDPFTEPLPLPVNPPLTPLLALADCEEPMSAVAPPFAPKPPVAVLPPVVAPVISPLPCELVLAIPEVPTEAVEVSEALPETEPPPGPEMPPFRFAEALADMPDVPPETAALPEPPKEAEPPPVVLADPVAAVWADGPEAPFDAVEVSEACDCALPVPLDDALLFTLALATPPLAGAADAEPAPAPDADALPLVWALDEVCADAVPDCAAAACVPAFADVLALPPPTLAAAAPLPAAAAAALPFAAETPLAMPVALPVAEPPLEEAALAEDCELALALPPPAVAVFDEDAPLLAVPAPFTPALPLVLELACACSAWAFARLSDNGWTWTTTGTAAMPRARPLAAARSMKRDRVLGERGFVMRCILSFMSRMIRTVASAGGMTSSGRVLDRPRVRIDHSTTPGCPEVFFRCSIFRRIVFWTIGYLRPAVGYHGRRTTDLSHGSSRLLPPAAVFRHWPCPPA